MQTTVKSREVRMQKTFAGKCRQSAQQLIYLANACTNSCKGKRQICAVSSARPSELGTSHHCLFEKSGISRGPHHVTKEPHFTEYQPLVGPCDKETLLLRVTSENNAGWASKQARELQLSLAPPLRRPPANTLVSGLGQPAGVMGGD